VIVPLRESVEAILGKGDLLCADDVKTEVETAASEGLTLEVCDTWMMWGNRNRSGIIGFQEGVVLQTIFK
jgi:hypothetical protein